MNPKHATQSGLNFIIILIYFVIVEYLYTQNFL